jgi:hypothetical protein
LRSGAYAALGRVPDAVRVDLVAERPDGTPRCRQPLY